jgi:hypothetical protein
MITGCLFFSVYATISSCPFDFELLLVFSILIIIELTALPDNVLLKHQKGLILGLPVLFKAKKPSFCIS